ncbi:MAG TPA: hypothetical protein G4O08_01515 [Anaerolineae bacterium]|nr:hypothetical protein [Anaerolineae bacterium]
MADHEILHGDEHGVAQMQVAGDVRRGLSAWALLLCLRPAALASQIIAMGLLRRN